MVTGCQQLLLYTDGSN